MAELKYAAGCRFILVGGDNRGRQRLCDLVKLAQRSITSKQASRLCGDGSAFP
jgi:hypothetical protein